MIISQLGAPVNQEALTTLPMPSFSAANRGHTVGHYTRTTRGLVDVKPCRQIIFSPRFEREIYGEPLVPKISIARDNTQSQESIVHYPKGLLLIVSTKISIANDKTQSSELKKIAIAGDKTQF